jgi:hypothetical protein
MIFYKIEKEAICLVQNLQLLKKSLDNLWLQGYPSTQLCRLLHNDYQIIFNDDINSPDEFYNLNRPENKPMIDLLNILGYDYTNFGICKTNNTFLK